MAEIPAELAALTAAVYKATDILQDSIDAVSDSQKVSAALGRTFSLGSSDLGGAIKKLDGTITQRLSVAFEALSKGVSLNSTGVLKLAEFQKVTNQDYKKTIELFQTLEKQLGFNSDSSNDLAGILDSTSKQYQVSTEFLVQSLSEFINANKDILNITNLAEPVVEAAAQVQGAFGPGLQKEVNKFLGILYSAGSENLSVINNLGLASIRQQISFAVTAEEQKALQLEAIRIAGQRVSEFQATYGKDITAVGAASKALFSDLGGSVVALFKKYDQAILENTKQQQVFYDINQRLLKVFDPVRESFFNLVLNNQDLINSLITLIELGINKFQDALSSNSAVLKTLFSSPLESIALLVGSVGASIIAIRTFSIALNQASASVVASARGTRAGRIARVRVGRLSQSPIGNILKPFSSIIPAITSGFKVFLIPLAKIAIIAGILVGVFEGIKSSIESTTGGLEGFKVRLKPVIDAVMAFGEVLFSIGRAVGVLIFNILDFLMPAITFVADVLSATFTGIANLFSGLLGGPDLSLKNTLTDINSSLQGIDKNTGEVASIAKDEASSKKAKLAIESAGIQAEATILEASKASQSMLSLINAFEEGRVTATVATTRGVNTGVFTKNVLKELNKETIDTLQQLISVNEANLQVVIQALSESIDTKGILQDNLLRSKLRAQGFIF